MRCECGCAYEGEDEIAQYLFEEALMLRLDQHDARLQATAMETAASDAAIAKSLDRRAKLQQAA